MYIVYEPFFNYNEFIKKLLKLIRNNDFYVNINILYIAVLCYKTLKQIYSHQQINVFIHVTRLFNLYSFCKGNWWMPNGVLFYSISYTQTLYIAEKFDMCYEYTVLYIYLSLEVCTVYKNLFLCQKF